MSRILETFSNTSQKPAGKKPPPFSLRLSEEERAKLDVAAAGAPLGSFIKSKLFDGDLTPRRTRGQTPVKDHAALARALGLLGRLNLTASLSELVEASKSGAVEFSPETEEELLATCAAVLAIRAELMKALGYSAEDDE